MSSSGRTSITPPSIPHPSIATRKQRHNDYTTPDVTDFLNSVYQSLSPLPLNEPQRTTQPGCWGQKQTDWHHRRNDSLLNIDLSAIDSLGPSHPYFTLQRSQERPSQGDIPRAAAYLLEPTPARPFPASWLSMYAHEYTHNSMGLNVLSPAHALIRQNSHQRTPSASTIASNGPPSPNNITPYHPQIANTDYDPDFDRTFSKDPTIIPDPTYLSVDYARGTRPTDMKGFAFDNHQVEDFSSPSSGGLTTSSMDDQPVTPGMTPDETDGKQAKNAEFRLFNPSVQLTRTESAVYQDELYNPANFRSNTTATKPTKPQVSTSRPQRTLMSQRLENANQARSHSPTSQASRDRSPFREGSSLAPADSWTSPRAAMTAAATRAQQLKEEREEAERSAIRRPQLQREPTKTISPKDALLDYNESSDQPSLFQDSVPLGYKQHLGGNDAVNNSYIAQQQLPTTFTLPPSSSQTSMAGFRAAGSADAFSNANFTFAQPALPITATAGTAASLQNAFQQLNNYQQMSGLTPSFPVTTSAAAAITAATPATSIDATPDFPAHLTSMESSISEGPPMSSQESGSVVTLQRPADVRANTGTYTCTYHGCAQRFDSPASLQKHKREYHRSQQHIRDSPSVKTSSESPRSTESPGPSSSAGLTSAQILARNSQAGPHKCARINPSTGKPCNTIFSRPYDLTRHEDTIHNGRKQKVRCPYCREEKTFSRNDALTRHMRVVHPDIENFGKRRRGD